MSHYQWDLHPHQPDGPDFLFLDSGTDYPPGEATIVLQIDDSRRQWQVRLPDGVSKNSERVALAVV